MKALAYIWGIGGVLLFLIFAIYRLAPMALALQYISMGFFHWVLLIFSVIYMAYAEGYRGFHLGFAPRVVKRALYLMRKPKLRLAIFAPVFCMGYIHATKRRQISSLGLTGLIVCFVVLVRLLPQPWRGILDAGVVTGLTIGCLSIIYYIFYARGRPEVISISSDVPGEREEG